MKAPLRSFLFVPGDSERKIEKASGSNADAIVLDLEDSVAPARKSFARGVVAERLGLPSSGPRLWVRINSLAGGEALADLAAITVQGLCGILVPKAESPQEIIRVSDYLDALEVRAGLQPGSIRIIPVATETAAAPFSLGDYRHARIDRLYGLTWGAEDLSAALGASTNKDVHGQLALTYLSVRSLTLLAAKAAGAEAVDTVYPDFRDLDGLRHTAEAARREGFSGCFAIHPAQVEIINEAYSPNAEELEFAERVVAAFAAAPDAGVVALEGRMLDLPHLSQARKLLALRDAYPVR